MADRRGGRAILVVAVVVAFAVAISFFWGYLYKRQGSRSASFATGATASPSATPTNPASASPSLAATAGPLPKVAGRALRLWVVGDGIARGDFASGPSTRYLGKLVSALRERGPVKLSTSQSPLSSLVTVPHDVDVAVFEFGTYDIPNVDVPEFSSAYEQLTQALRAASPHAVLVCAGTWSLTGAAYDTAIARSCVASQGHFVPLRCLYATASNRGPAGRVGRYGVSDDQAPNDAGHLAIAKALLHPLALNGTPTPRPQKSPAKKNLNAGCPAN